ncbi:MAG: hypothetical protein NWE76_02630, partial [Candidatus Bathyarchaeota archaeon]|nr:hypothetical protein [Candidatus Bathyarchaeota archaeon]
VGAYKTPETQSVRYLLTLFEMFSISKKGDETPILPGQLAPVFSINAWKTIGKVQVNLVSGIEESGYLMASEPVRLEDLRYMKHHQSATGCAFKVSTKEASVYLSEHRHNKMLGKVGCINIRPPATPRGFVPSGYEKSFDGLPQFEVNPISAVDFFEVIDDRDVIEDACPKVCAFVEDPNGEDMYDVASGETRKVSRLESFPVSLDPGDELGLSKHWESDLAERVSSANAGEDVVFMGIAGACDTTTTSRETYIRKAPVYSELYGRERPYRGFTDLKIPNRRGNKMADISRFKRP